MMEAFYNSSRHESTGKTPFEMDGVVWTDAMTLALRSPITTGVTSQSAEDILTDMKVAWEDARKMLMSKQVKMKEEADRHRRDEQYAVGDKVLLSTRRLNRKASALSDPYVGPFTITRVSDNGVNVWLDLPKKLYGRLHQLDRLGGVAYHQCADSWYDHCGTLQVCSRCHVGARAQRESAAVRALRSRRRQH